jgi:hypothetical protein
VHGVQADGGRAWLDERRQMMRSKIQQELVHGGGVLLRDGLGRLGLAVQEGDGRTKQRSTRAFSNRSRICWLVSPTPMSAAYLSPAARCQLSEEVANLVLDLPISEV